MATGGGSLNTLLESGPEFVLIHKFEENIWTLPSIFSQECGYIPWVFPIRKDIDVIVWSNMLEKIYKVYFNHNVPPDTYIINGGIVSKLMFIFVSKGIIETSNWIVNKRLQCETG